jgi:ligand-binding SRPBCC domain-containing protein
MAEHILKRQLTLDRPRREVFDLFADAGNLERITPPELEFHIITPRPIAIAKGTLIDYRLRMLGIPMKWRTEISVWDPPFEFTDQQLQGPYAQWIHRHTFTKIDENNTLIEDEVRYRLPLEPLGDLLHFLIRKELDHIFDFRQRAVSERLSNNKESTQNVKSCG